MGATIIVDAFWGDAGKGKFCAYLTIENMVKLVVRAGTGTNAGHSFFINDKFVKSRMIPLGAAVSDAKGIISSGVAVDPNIFHDEVKKLKVDGHVFIDWRCPIIEQKHIEKELRDSMMRKIDSTKSGTGNARADFIMRRGKQAKDIESLSNYLIDGISVINETARKETIIIEGSQATFLSLYASDRYPFVTSDNCTTSAFIDDAGLNWQLVDRVILLVKCLPTCVGLGPLPYEMCSKKIAELNLQEYGVNTGREKRRSSQIDWERLKYSVLVNGPTEIALTFCDQYDPPILGARKQNRITPRTITLINKVEKVTKIPVTYLSTGNQLHDMVRVKS